MRLIRSIATIGIYTIGSRIVGFLRTMMMATFVGAGNMGDALVIAIKIPSVLRRLFAEGAFNASFVPIFAGLLAKEGSDKARSYAEEVFSILVLGLVFLVIVAEIFMPQIMPLLVSGFSKTPERMHYVIEFTRITFPFILFISVCALYSGILNSMEKFAAAAASPMFGNVAIIATAYILLPATSNPGVAFAWGITMCGVVQALVVLIPLWRAGMGLRLKVPSLTPETKKFFMLLGPAAAGSGVVQINIFLDMLIASFLPTGSVSFLEYADRLNQLPLSVIGVAMGTALLPMLSKQIRVHDYEKAQTTQSLALEYALVLAFPAAIGFFMLAMPMSQTVYQQGKLLPHDALEISKTLMAFSLGMPAYILIKIFVTIFFSREDTKTPVYVGVLAVVVNLALNLLLYRTFAHVGLALSTAISAWVNAGVLFYTLKHRGFLVLSDRFKVFMPRLFLCSAGTIGTVFALRYFYWSPTILSKFEQTYKLTGICVISLLVYLGLCFITRIFKTSDLDAAMKMNKKKA